VEAAPPVNGTASPNILIFQYYVGSDAAALGASIWVDADSRTTYTVVSPVPWLKLSNTSGGTPGTVSVKPNPAGMAPGVYQTTLIFNFPRGESAEVSVQLQVIQILVQATPASLRFTAQAGSTAAQTANVAVYAFGKNMPVAVSIAGAAWLTASASASSTPFTLQAKVSPAGMAPGTYSGTIVLTGDGALNSPLSIPVTLTVEPVPLPQPAIAVAGISNAASMQPGPAAPNTIVSAFGTFPGCNTGAQVSIDASRTTVFDSTPSQINFLVPASVAGQASAGVQITCGGLTSQPIPLPIAAVSPAIFTAGSSGAGQAAIVNQSGSINVPCTAGESIQVYTTGFGALAPRGADGLARVMLPVTATVGDIAASVLYAGEAPGYTNGMQQINISIPPNVVTGIAVPLMLRAGNSTTQAGVTIVIQPRP
jgi:uncharacterized protein (TIGR03437 family)